MTTTQEMINDLHASLVTEQPNITVLEYVKVLNENFFNIDISFIDDFIDMVDKDGFNISHEMLFKYEVLTKSETSNDIFRILERYNFEDTVDYLRKIARVDDGRTEKIFYMLSSDVFKIICMRSLKTKKFSRYYILLEKCIKY